MSDQAEQRAREIMRNSQSLRHGIAAALREAWAASESWENTAIKLSNERAKLWQEADALRDQLAAAQAEAARLRVLLAYSSGVYPHVDFQAYFGGKVPLQELDDAAHAGSNIARAALAPQEGT